MRSHPFVEPPRVRIPGLCWIPKPGQATPRCTEPEGHDNPQHFHWPTREEWPRYPGETQ